MDIKKKPNQTTNPEDNAFNRAGGIAAILFGVAYVVIIALYIPLGRPTGVEAWLISMAGNTAQWWGILALSVLTDFLLVPFTLSLFLALKRVNRNGMLLATAFVGLFIVLDLSLTWTNYASLIGLSRSYATATGSAEKAILITAALYPSSVVESNLLFVYNSLTLSIGILIIGLIMRRGIFSKSSGYLGLATGILGIVSVASSFFSSSLSGVTIILASTLTMIWSLFAGYELFKLRQQ